MDIKVKWKEIFYIYKQRKENEVRLQRIGDETITKQVCHDIYAMLAVSLYFKKMCKFYFMFV